MNIAKVKCPTCGRDVVVFRANKFANCLNQTCFAVFKNPLYESGAGETEVVQPNPEALAIVRLFLEKHETLSADERKEILTCIRFLNSPVLKLSPTLDSIDTKTNFDTIKP